LVGPTGVTGTAGPQGIAGNTGPTGSTGPAGVQGNAGQTGPTGILGPTGSTGTAGGLADTVSTAVAAAGTTQGTATVLTSIFSEVTTVAANAGVQTPTFMSTPGRKCRIASYGANQLNVYPLTGQSIISVGINLGANAAVVVRPGVVAELECVTATTIYTVP
jgi:hypothetical protein